MSFSPDPTHSEIKNGKLFSYTVLLLIHSSLMPPYFANVKTCQLSLHTTGYSQFTLFIVKSWYSLIIPFYQNRFFQCVIKDVIWCPWTIKIASYLQQSSENNKSSKPQRRRSQFFLIVILVNINILKWPELGMMSICCFNK